MPISIACQCGKKLTVKDELAGKRVRCPGCQAILSVAAPAKAPVAAAKPKPSVGTPQKNGAAVAKPAAPAPARAAPPADEDEENQEHEAPARKPGRTVPHDDEEEEEQSQQHGEEEDQAEDDEEDRPTKKRHADEEDEEEESSSVGEEEDDDEPVVKKKPSRKVEMDEEEEEEQEEDQQEEEEPVARKKPGRKFEPDEEEEEAERQEEEEEPVVKKKSSRKARIEDEDEEEEEEEEERPRGKKGSKKAAKAEDDEEEEEKERPKKGKSKSKGKLTAPPPMLNFTKFIVKAKAKGGKKTFAIQDAESGDVIATAKNATGFLSNLIGSVVYGVMDGTTDELAFTVGRTGWPLKKDQVVDGKGRVVGRFKSKFLTLAGGFHVYDEKEEHVCEIKGKLRKSEYKFLTPDGDEMGSVSKTWGGAFKSLMTGAGTYGVQVEDEYADDARIKMIMLAATIAVETIFQKPKSGKSAGDDDGGDEE